ncbi:MAG: PAS domain S-box protein, partial [Saprospiraceae bacterium]
MTISDTWNYVSSMALSETVQVLVITIDKGGRVTRINNAGCKILQVKEEQIVGESWIECFVDEDCRAQASQALNQLLTGEQEIIQDIAYRALSSGGQPFPFHWNKRVIKDKNGSIAGILASGMPVDDGVDFGGAGERIRFALMSGKIGVYDWDVVHRKGIWNDELKKIFELPGRARDDIGAHWRSILHPEDKDWVIEGMREVIKHGKSFKKEYRLQFPDGRVKYVSPTSVLILNEKGEVTRAIGTIVDITERKEAEKKFAEQQERLQLAVNATKIGYHDLDMVTGRRYWDENIHKTLKIDPSSDVDRLALFLSVLHPDDRPRVEQRIAVLRSPECKDTTFDENFRLCLDGKIRYFNSKGIVVRDEQGNGLRMFGAALEVTEQKEAELKLIEREEKYRTLFENANDAILVLEGGVFIECNSLALELYGCDSRKQL